MLKKHLIVCLRSSSSCALNPEKHPIRQRPVCLAARCQSDLIAISLIEENGVHIDWVEEDELHLSDVQLIQSEDFGEIPSVPIHALDEHLSSPRTNPE